MENNKVSYATTMGRVVGFTSDTYASKLKVEYSVGEEIYIKTLSLGLGRTFTPGQVIKIKYAVNNPKMATLALSFE